MILLLRVEVRCIIVFLRAMEFEKYFFKNRFAICSHVAVQGDAIIGFQFLEWSDPNWSGIDKLPSNWGLIATYIKQNCSKTWCWEKTFWCY